MEQATNPSQTPGTAQPDSKPGSEETPLVDRVRATLERAETIVPAVVEASKWTLRTGARIISGIVLSAKGAIREGIDEAKTKQQKQP